MRIGNASTRTRRHSVSPGSLGRGRNRSGGCLVNRKWLSRTDTRALTPRQIRYAAVHRLGEAYQNVYANQGAMTPGADGTTLQKRGIALMLGFRFP